MENFRRLFFSFLVYFYIRVYLAPSTLVLSTYLTLKLYRKHRKTNYMTKSIDDYAKEFIEGLEKVEYLAVHISTGFWFLLFYIIYF
jgi:hypothetical protein